MGKALWKFLSRLVDGEVTRVPVKIDDMTLNAVRHSKRSLENYRDTVDLWKEFKDNPFKRADLYKPGRAFDPKALADDAAAIDAHDRAELGRKILEKYSDGDELGLRRGKKSAEKVQGVMDSIMELMGKTPPSGEHLTGAQILEKARKPMSRHEFAEALTSDPVLSKAKRSSFYGDAADYLEADRGGSGKAGLRHYENQRRRDAKRLMAEIEPQVSQLEGRPSELDQNINEGLTALQRFMKKRGLT